MIRIRITKSFEEYSKPYVETRLHPRTLILIHIPLKIPQIMKRKSTSHMLIMNVMYSTYSENIDGKGVVHLI